LRREYENIVRTIENKSNYERAYSLPFLLSDFVTMMMKVIMSVIILSSYNGLREEEEDGKREEEEKKRRWKIWNIVRVFIMSFN
jgi:hypothetical protein